jgi:hypothetical protein
VQGWLLCHLENIAQNWQRGSTRITRRYRPLKCCRNPDESAHLAAMRLSHAQPRGLRI